MLINMRTDTDISLVCRLLCHSLVSLDLNIFTVVLVTVSVLSLFQLSSTLVCCTWNLHIGHVLLMLTVSNPCVILKS